MATAARAPWHLWLVGLLGIPWNGFGVFDYVMSKTRGEPYFREVGMTDAQIATMAAMPAWTTAVWAIGVFTALIGTLLLLARSRLAVPVFAVSLAAYVLSLIYTYLLSDAGKHLGGPMPFVILAGCIFFLLYARWAAKAGILR